MEVDGELDEVAEALQKRPLRTPVPELHHPVTDDGVPLLLTRFHGGDRGPVILAPGFGVSTLSFTTDTVNMNLPEYLVSNGYDVWLLDYRASPILPSARTRFTINDVAQRDWPAAVNMVRDHTGADSVQALGHCVGSMSLLMGLLSGRVEGVRSVVSSQLTTHPRTTTENRIKAWIRVAEWLDRFGVDTVTTDVRKGFRDELFDVLLRANPIPREEDCQSPVCRRIFALYGISYRHAQLNDATHRAIPAMFGMSGIGAFEHLSLIVRKGHVVDAGGGDSYMSHPDRLRIPIRFIAGAENQIFLPESSKLTYEWLQSANDPSLYSRTVIPDYGHMDCFVGRNAAIDVYPIVLEHLEGT